MSINVPYNRKCLKYVFNINIYKASVKNILTRINVCQCLLNVDQKLVHYVTILHVVNN